MCLCDTTTSKDIHINDTLVSQGLAVFVPDTVDDEANYDNYQLEPPPSEVLTDRQIDRLFSLSTVIS